MPEAEGGRIFVSYRRQESSHLAGRLYDRLAGRFGEDQVFIDVDTIEPGVDFAEEIFRAVTACQVLLVIIGLMEGAVMPARQDLPESLAGLARRNALPIRHDSFRSD